MRRPGRWAHRATATKPQRLRRANGRRPIANALRGEHNGAMRSWVWTISLACLGWSVGCAPTGPMPRVIAPVLVEGEHLELSVAPYGDRTQDPPRILAVRVLAGGLIRQAQFRALPPTPDDPIGQRIALEAPDSRRFVLELIVAMGRRHFELTIPYRPSGRPDYRWKRGVDQVKVLGDQGPCEAPRVAPSNPKG